MPSAEIITIGTELLLGEIVDTNSRSIARSLREAGIDLYRTTTVGDNVERIAKILQEAMQRCDIIITTGGLGPTVDDPTREAVALALGVKAEFQPELWEQIQARFRRMGRVATDNNRRQAYIPEGAQAFENPVGTAPIFILEQHSKLVISLPGVPSEMEYLMANTVIPYIKNRTNIPAIIKSRVLHTVGIGESQIDDSIGDLEKLSNPTVGLAAHSGQVDVRITAKAESEEQVTRLIEPLEITLRSRLGDSIYGTDQETLEEVSLRSISSNNWSFTVTECGLGGYIVRRLAPAKGPFVGGLVLAGKIELAALLQETDEFRQRQQADVGLGVLVETDQEIRTVHIVLITPHETQQFARKYGGPAEYVYFWAFNQSLDLIRRIEHGNNR